MAILLLHDDLVIEDQVVYATGHAYRRCKFNRCTFYVRDLQGVFEECNFSGCVWHLDMIVHDPAQLPAIENLLRIMQDSLRAAQAPPDSP